MTILDDLLENGTSPPRILRRLKIGQTNTANPDTQRDQDTLNQWLDDDNEDDMSHVPRCGRTGQRIKGYGAQLWQANDWMRSGIP